MNTPVEITFLGMSPSPAVEAVIQRWAARLDRVCERIQRCSVTVGIPHRHKSHGNAVRVGIEVTVPDRVIAVSREPGRDPTHEDVYNSIADAFRAARRQLLDYTSGQRAQS
jgi:ribosome-associated translation inhibitor RaiA